MFDRWNCDTPIGRLLFIPIAIICVVEWLILTLFLTIIGGLVSLLSLPIQWVIWGKCPMWGWIGDIIEHKLGRFIFGKNAWGEYPPIKVEKETRS